MYFLSLFSQYHDKSRYIKKNNDEMRQDFQLTILPLNLITIYTSFYTLNSTAYNSS